MGENSHNCLEIEQRKGSCSTTCQDTLPSYMNLNNVVLALVQTKGDNETAQNSETGKPLRELGCERDCYYCNYGRKDR